MAQHVIHADEARLKKGQDVDAAPENGSLIADTQAMLTLIAGYRKTVVYITST